METVGAATWSHSINSLKPGGAVVISGATSGDAPAKAELTKIFFQQLRVVGSTMGTRGRAGAAGAVRRPAGDRAGRRPRRSPWPTRGRASRGWSTARSSARSSSPSDRGPGPSARPSCPRRPGLAAGPCGSCARRRAGCRRTSCARRGVALHPPDGVADVVPEGVDRGLDVARTPAPAESPEGQCCRVPAGRSGGRPGLAGPRSSAPSRRSAACRCTRWRTCSASCAHRVVEVVLQVGQVGLPGPDLGPAGAR